VVDVAAGAAFGVYMGWWDEFGMSIVAELDFPAVVMDHPMMVST
jgi:hypothetical protein